MERTFSPMIRQYSAIDGLQQAYTLVYAMEVEGTQGCRLTLCQIELAGGAGRADVAEIQPAGIRSADALAVALAGCGHRPDSCRAGRRERRRMA